MRTGRGNGGLMLLSLTNRHLLARATASQPMNSTPRRLLARGQPSDRKGAPGGTTAAQDGGIVELQVEAKCFGGLLSPMRPNPKGYLLLSHYRLMGRVGQ